MNNGERSTSTKAISTRQDNSKELLDLKDKNNKLNDEITKLKQDNQKMKKVMQEYKRDLQNQNEAIQQATNQNIDIDGRIQDLVNQFDEKIKEM